MTALICATGALSGVLLARLHDGSPRPMALIVAVSAVASALAFWLVRRSMHRT